MSEAPCEAFLLLALALGLLGLARRSLAPAVGGRAGLGPVASGLLAGLSILAKFNGVLALVCFAAWCLLGLVLPGIAAERSWRWPRAPSLAVVVGLVRRSSS